ncbi:UNVERIFIED_CONTAM: hypothetical protein Slati_3828900 [Sesamum latifolium]|uniref:Uncharacterized protein n=1 Tax=Sesamum latifolium TaxID=2727402 RepID=A0AAW2TL96_9LAMI
MTSLDLNQQPLCIEYPTLDVDFELKSGLIHLLPTFRGLAGNTQQVKACGICTSLGHATDACPTLQEEPTIHANAIGGFSGPSQRGHDPFFNTYNPGWRDHPNLRYGNQPQNFQRGPYQPPPPPPQSNSNTGMPLDIVKTLALSTQQFQQETRSSIQNLEPISLLRQSFGIPRGKIGEELENSPKQAEKSNQVGEEHPRCLCLNLPFRKDFSSPKRRKRRRIFLKLYAKLSIYESLNIGPLKETWVVLQLADRSIVYPEGVLEDVLVQVNELVFFCDFYVINMMDNSPNSTSILLGRPFLKTSKTKIDVDAGILSMEFDNEVVSFSIDGVTQNSNDMHSVFLIDFIDPLVRGNAMFDGGGASKLTKNKSPTSSSRTYKNKAFHEKDKFKEEVIHGSPSSPKSTPSPGALHRRSGFRTSNSLELSNNV